MTADDAKQILRDELNRRRVPFTAITAYPLTLKKKSELCVNVHGCPKDTEIQQFGASHGVLVFFANRA